MSTRRTMEQRKLGKDGPEISVIGYGAWEAGGGYHSANPPDEEPIRAMRAALDHGVSWVDTAEAYGAGRSEELVGQAVAGRGHKPACAAWAASPSTSTNSTSPIRRSLLRSPGASWRSSSIKDWCVTSASRTSLLSWWSAANGCATPIACKCTSLCSTTRTTEPA